MTKKELIAIKNRVAEAIKAIGNIDSCLTSERLSYRILTQDIPALIAEIRRLKVNSNKLKNENK